MPYTRICFTAVQLASTLFTPVNVLSTFPPLKFENAQAASFAPEDQKEPPTNDALKNVLFLRTVALYLPNVPSFSLCVLCNVLLQL